MRGVLWALGFVRSIPLLSVFRILRLFKDTFLLRVLGVLGVPRIPRVPRVLGS